MSSLTRGLQFPVRIRWRCEFAISGLVLSYSKILVWVLKYTGKWKMSLLTCHLRFYHKVCGLKLPLQKKGHMEIVSHGKR